jgi:hypothetical protein
MNAGTRLVALISLLWALAVVGGVNHDTAAPSSPRAKKIAINHNETMVRDAGSVERSARWSDWLRTVLAAVFAKARVSGGCDDEFGCSGNHNETMVRDVAR